jgi:hypothetical protein
MKFTNIILRTVPAEDSIYYEIHNIILSTVTGFKLGTELPDDGIFIQKHVGKLCK